MLKLKDGFIVRRIGPQTMAVPVGPRTSEIHGMIGLTESGALLWQAMEGGAEREELLRLLTDTYEVDPARAAEDLDGFLAGLREQGALE